MTKKNVGKIDYGTKIFITKIYSNIDKCHIIFALLASKRLRHMHSALIQNRQCRALALHARNVAIWTMSREKIYHGLWAVGNPLTTWAVSASSVVRNFSSGLPPRWSAEHWVPQKSRMLCISCRMVLNLPVLIHRL